MRELLPLAFILLLATAAFAETLADAGVNPIITPPEKTKSWNLPYAPAKDCNNIFVFWLKAGTARIYDGNRLVLEANTPGKYRAVLNNAGGVLKIELIRKTAESNAEIGPKSYITCDKIPIIEMNAEIPPVFHAGGYDAIIFHIKNVGTAPAKINVLLDLPEDVAPLTPKLSYNVDAGAERNIIIPVTTADTFPQQLLRPQCIEYSDRHGEYKECTDFGITNSSMLIPIECIIHNKAVEVINIGTKTIELNDAIIPPATSHSFKELPEQKDVQCVKTLKIEKMPNIEKGMWRAELTVISAILGVFGWVLAEKKIKRRKE
jgi:hypothetical protein